MFVFKFVKSWFTYLDYIFTYASIGKQQQFIGIFDRENFLIIKMKSMSRTMNKGKESKFHVSIFHHSR